MIEFLQTNFNRYVKTKYGNLQYETLHEKNISHLAKTLPSILVFEMPIEIPIENSDVIEKLRNMTADERKKLGIRKTTLWYLQKKLKEGKTVKPYSKAKRKLT